MTMRWYGAEWEARLRQGAMHGVVEGLGIVEQRAIYLITNPPKSGRVYKRRGVEHQASAPGEAPASDTGTLVNARQTKFDQQNVSGRLTFTSRHAEMLERGTRKMEPRPWARRALMETRAQVTAAIQRGVARALGHG